MHDKHAKQSDGDQPSSHSTGSSVQEPLPAKRRFQLVSKKGLRNCAVLLGILLVGVFVAWAALLQMPGTAHSGPLPAMTEAQREASDRLRADVETLAVTHLGRSVLVPAKYEAAAVFLETSLQATGLSVTVETYELQEIKTEVKIIVAELPGRTVPAQIVVVGAHYDTAHGMPGADDNASGVAGVLELARRFAGLAGDDRPERTIRFVCFPNEEPPYFQTEEMGSLVYARRGEARGDDVRAMLSVEMIGYFDTAPGSQRYPIAPLKLVYPDTGDFITFVGNVQSVGLVRRATRTFRESIAFPAYGAALPESVPGAGWSDHWAYWQIGVPAIMATDTASNRNPNYHTPQDTADTLDYERMSRVVDGLEAVVRDLATADAP